MPLNFMDFLSLSSAINDISVKLGTWLDSIILNLPNFILAVLVFIIFIYIARYTYRFFIRFLHSRNLESSFQYTLARLIRIVIIGIGFFIALGLLNLDKLLTSVLAGAGIIGIAISFALQGTLSNTISGFILSAMPQIKLHDWIETKDYEGEVLEVNLRNILIKESDNNHVIIPNSMIVEAPFKNFSTTPRSRISINSRISFNTDLELVEKLLTKAIRKEFPPKKGEGIELYFEEFSDESITFVVRFWTDVRRSRHIRIARHKGINIIKRTFDENNIRIPYPIRSIDIREKK